MCRERASWNLYSVLSLRATIPGSDGRCRPFRISGSVMYTNLATSNLSLATSVKIACHVSSTVLSCISTNTTGCTFWISARSVEVFTKVTSGLIAVNMKDLRLSRVTSSWNSYTCSLSFLMNTIVGVEVTLKYCATSLSLAMSTFPVYTSVTFASKMACIRSRNTGSVL